MLRLPRNIPGDNAVIKQRPLPVNSDTAFICFFTSPPYFLSPSFSLPWLPLDRTLVGFVISSLGTGSDRTWPALTDSSKSVLNSKSGPSASVSLYFYCGRWDVCTVPVPTSHRESAPTEFSWYRNRSWWAANSTNKRKYSSKFLLILVAFICNPQR